MSRSIKELITENIQQALAGITLASGYENDAVSEREKVRGNSPRERHVVISDNGDTVLSSAPVQKDEYHGNYQISISVAMTDEESETFIDGVLAGLAADVRKALMVDYTRGGNAIDTMPGSLSKAPFDRSSGEAVATLDLTVHYRTAKDDPFSL